MSSTTSLAPISASDLLRKQFDPLRWIVPEIIPEGLTLLAGPPKIGKSWLCLDLALAVAGYGHFLDEVEVETGDVLYLALDDTQRRLQERIRRLLGEHPVPERLDIFSADHSAPSLVDGGLELVEQWMASRAGPCVLIVDTWSKWTRPRRGEKRAIDRQEEAVAALVDRVREHKLALVVAYHTRKTNPDAVVEAAGAQLRLSSLIENVLMLRRPHADCDTILSVTGRDVRDQELLLEWNAEETYWWLRGPVREVRMSLSREAVLDVLELAGEALTPKEVFEILQDENMRDPANPVISYDAVRQRMFQMRRAGILHQALFGRYFLPPAADGDENDAK